MNVKMEEQSAMNNDQLQVDRRLLNICRPKIRVYTLRSTQLEQSTGKDEISLIRGVVLFYRSVFSYVLKGNS